MSKVGYNLAMISGNTQGVHVLLVDSDLWSLASITRMLEYLSYKVTVTQNGRAALSILSDSANRINLVLTDIRLPDVNGFIVLSEAVKKDIPIIVMSNNEDSMTMKMALHYGASFFIHKPLSSLMAKDLWQFVARAKVVVFRNLRVDRENDECDSDSSETVSLDISERNPKRSKNRMQRISTAWTEELHAKFVDAVIQLGDGNCYPKEILETMNVPGLTRMQVASHLQKCRDGMWLGPEDYRPFIREARVSNPGRLNSLRKFGAMPLSVKLQLRNEIRNGSRAAGPELRLGIGLPDTASSSKEVGSDIPSSSSSNGNSVGLEFYKIMAKLGRANGSLKLRSPKKEPANP